MRLSFSPLSSHSLGVISECGKSRGGSVEIPTDDNHKPKPPTCKIFTNEFYEKCLTKNILQFTVFDRENFISKHSKILLGISHRGF